MVVFQLKKFKLSSMIDKIVMLKKKTKILTGLIEEFAIKGDSILSIFFTFIKAITTAPNKLTTQYNEIFFIFKLKSRQKITAITAITAKTIVKIPIVFTQILYHL